MFICRIRLVPRFSLLPLPSLHSHVITTQRFSSRATTPSRQCLAVRFPFHTPSSSSTHASERDLPPTDNTQISGDHLSRRVIRDPKVQPFTKDGAKKEDDKDPSSTLYALYAHLDTREFSKLAIQLSSEQVRGIALRARQSRRSFVLDNLSRNILDSPEAVRTELATALLSIPRLHLNPSLAASLLFCITPDHLSSLSLDALSYIACTLIHHPSPSDTTIHLTRLAEDIARRLEPPWVRRNHHPSLSNGHTIPIWRLFRLVVHLSELHLREPTMRVLQSLMEAAYIPPEAVQRTDQSSGDFHIIIIFTLIRSCIFWKWNRRALALLRDYLGRKPPVGPIISRLCQDVLYALIEFPTAEDLDLGVSFVRDMVSRPEPISISPDIVRQIYSSAQSLGQPQIATNLYMLAQSGSIQSLHDFPLPSGTALTWFLRHLSKKPAYLHHARGLVKQVADHFEPVPLADRAEFIALAAESGFASSARLLWERYSSGRGGRIVAGNAAMMVRLCSLFANLCRRKSAPKSETSGLADATLASLVDISPHDDSNHRISSLEEEEDFRSFASLVLTRYREAKEPLCRASQEDLNALARANIILGHVTEGLRVLRVVIDRNGYPDLYDINVVLSGLANLDPRKAMRMVRRMATHGPKPDGISIGTVIHHAARHGNFAVITDLLQLAQKIGQQLTTKTMVTVIRASVAVSGADKGALRDNLVRALEVIMANEHSNHLATLDMGRFCADEALRADDPALAFEFWKHVLQPKAEWDDAAHVSLRRRIARSIRSHCEKGHIHAEDEHRMTLALSRRRRGVGD
ncbi:hypothetical protein BC827DRAFT_18451 [Russula dissimulans]|nr:hypothetical protein BC827DRAFT_18451 [Russula dissimulans]